MPVVGCTVGKHYLIAPWFVAAWKLIERYVIRRVLGCLGAGADGDMVLAKLLCPSYPIAGDLVPGRTK